MKITSSLTLKVPFSGKSEPVNDGSLQPVKLYAKIRKMPDDDLTLFINVENPDDLEKDLPYETRMPRETPLRRDSIGHDLLEHVLTSSSFSALSNVGGEFLHGGSGGDTKAKDRIPRGAIDYVPFLRRLASGTQLTREEDLSLETLIKEFWKLSRLGDELLLPFLIPPPDRSYTYPNPVQKQPFTVWHELEPSNLWKQVKKDGGGESIRLPRSENELLCINPKDKERIISYRIDKAGRTIRGVTRFYPVGDVEEYTNAPYRPMELGKVRIREADNAKRFKGSYLHSVAEAFREAFTRVEEEKEKILKAGSLFGGKNILAIDDRFGNKGVANVMADTKLLNRLGLKKFTWPFQSPKKTVKSVNPQVVFKHFFKEMRKFDLLQKHYPPEYQPKFISLPPPLKAKEIKEEKSD